MFFKARTATVRKFLLIASVVTSAVFLIIPGFAARADDISLSPCGLGETSPKNTSSCHVYLKSNRLADESRIIIDATTEFLSPPTCRGVGFCRIGEAVPALLVSGIPDIDSKVTEAGDRALSKLTSYISSIAPRSETTLVIKPGHLEKECTSGGSLIVARFYTDQAELDAYQNDLKHSPGRLFDAVPPNCTFGGLVLIKRDIDMGENAKTE